MYSPILNQLYTDPTDLESLFIANNLICRNRLINGNYEVHQVSYKTLNIQQIDDLKIGLLDSNSIRDIFGGVYSDGSDANYGFLGHHLIPTLITMVESNRLIFSHYNLKYQPEDNQGEISTHDSLNNDNIIELVLDKVDGDEVESITKSIYNGETYYHDILDKLNDVDTEFESIKSNSIIGYVLTEYGDNADYISYENRNLSPDSDTRVIYIDKDRDEQQVGALGFQSSDQGYESIKNKDFVWYNSLNDKPKLEIYQDNNDPYVADLIKLTITYINNYNQSDVSYIDESGKDSVSKYIDKKEVDSDIVYNPGSLNLYKLSYSNNDIQMPITFNNIPISYGELNIISEVIYIPAFLNWNFIVDDLLIESNDSGIRIQSNSKSVIEFYISHGVIQKKI